MNNNFVYFQDLASIISFSAKCIFYICLISGIWLIFSDAVISHIKKSAFHERYRNIKAMKKTRPYRHVELLIGGAGGNNDGVHVYFFFAISGAIFITFLILLAKQSSILFASGASAVFASFPYIMLRLKLRNRRVEGSYEGEILIGELLNQYKINYFNMAEAIDRSVQFLRHAPISQKLLFKLSMRLKTCKSETELQDILAEFAYAIDTEWIRLLSNNIYLALQDGINVAAGMEDILKSCRRIRAAIEQNKRVNSEGFAIITLLNPAMYAGTVWIAIKYFDFTAAKLIKYQLGTEIGSRFFAVILILMFLNYAAMTMIKNKKFDY